MITSDPNAYYDSNSGISPITTVEVLVQRLRLAAKHADAIGLALKHAGQRDYDRSKEQLVDENVILAELLELSFTRLGREASNAILTSYLDKCTQALHKEFHFDSQPANKPKALVKSHSANLHERREQEFRSLHAPALAHFERSLCERGYVIKSLDKLTLSTRHSIGHTSERFIGQMTNNVLSFSISPIRIKLHQSKTIVARIDFGPSFETDLEAALSILERLAFKAS